MLTDKMIRRRKAALINRGFVEKEGVLFRGEELCEAPFSHKLKTINGKLVKLGLTWVGEEDG